MSQVAPVPKQNTTTCCSNVVAAIWADVCDDTINLPTLQDRVLQCNIGTYVYVTEGTSMLIIALLHILLASTSLVLSLKGTVLPLGGKRPAMCRQSVLNRSAKQLLGPSLREGVFLY